jgi:hypothetical protein
MSISTIVTIILGLILTGVMFRIWDAADEGSLWGILLSFLIFFGFIGYLYLVYFP